MQDDIDSFLLGDGEGGTETGVQMQAAGTNELTVLYRTGMPSDFQFQFFSFGLSQVQG